MLGKPTKPLRTGRAHLSLGRTTSRKKPLDDLCRFVFDDLEIDGSTAVNRHQGGRYDPVGFISPTAGRTMPEHQPETDAAQSSMLMANTACDRAAIRF
jgi:hypothetical protein